MGARGRAHVSMDFKTAPAPPMGALSNPWALAQCSGQLVRENSDDRYWWYRSLVRKNWTTATSLKLTKQTRAKLHWARFAWKSISGLLTGCQPPFFIKLCTRCRYFNESGADLARPLCRRELHHQQAATVLGATSRP